MSELVDQVKSVLRIPSASSRNPTNHQGNLDVVKHLVEWIGDRLQTRILDSDYSKKDVSLICWPHGKDFPSTAGLALHTHLDSVQAGELSAWTEGGPLEARENAGYITGLGAADVKSDAVCKIMALISATQTNPTEKQTPFFVGSFAEEIGMHGARWLHENKVIRPQYAMVGEPSDGKICYANKGLFVLEASLPFEAQKYSGKTFEVHYEGVSGHSSAPQKSVNALEAALDDLDYQISQQLPISSLNGSIATNVIPGLFSLKSGPSILPLDILQQLASLRKSHKKFQEELAKTEINPIFEPAYPTSSWTVCERLEDKISIELEGRFLPGQEPEALARNFVAENSILSFKRSSPACQEDTSTEFAQLAAKAAEDQDPWITKSGSNEAYFYQELGAQVFVHGPGVSYGNIHRPNERIAISSIQRAFHFYERLIKAVC